MQNMTEKIKAAIQKYLPDRSVHAIHDRGVWERHIMEVELDRHERVFFKIETSDLNMTGFEVEGVKLFQRHNLPTPRILAVDTSREIFPGPYIIQESVGGTRLGTLLETVDEDQVIQIYEALGSFYQKMHAIKSERSELLVPFPGAPSPAEFMFQAEIIGGSGKQAADQGMISQSTYQRLVQLWQKNLNHLKEHQPTLIHTSPFLWTIYLERDNLEWHITKLSPMAEIMWWDPAYNLAFLQYPPFGSYQPSRWQAFLRTYGAEPERKRILLYLVMQKLCAAMGVYKAPKTEQNQIWAEKCLSDVDLILDEIEG